MTADTNEVAGESR